MKLAPLALLGLSTPAFAAPQLIAEQGATPLWNVRAEVPAASLDYDGSNPGGVAADLGEERVLLVELGALDWATAGSSEHVVVLELFDQETHTVLLERRGTPRPGAAVWFGEWEQGDDSVMLAVQGEAMTASVRLGDELYKLRPMQGASSDRTSILSQVDTSQLPACGNTAAHAVSSSAQQPGGAPLNTPLAGPLTTVDVLVAYTPAAKNQSGGTNGMLSLIDLAVFETNNSFNNGNAQTAMRLVHAYETNYTESGSMGTDLSRFRSTSDNHMPEVHSLRTTYGADACALISTGGGACGVGYLMTSVSNGFKSSAFNTTARGCATGHLTFGHEFGHNFGCSHDKGNAGSSSKPYAYGYRTPNNQYRTVMSYSPGSRVPVFSSPLAEWNGWQMGAANSEDNGRALDLNNATIGNWYATKVAITDCNGNGVDDQIELAFGLASDGDGDGVLDECTSLAADTPTISILSGGTQNLSLSAGSEHAGRTFLLLGTISGTTPGTSLGSVTLPLNLDAYTNWLLSGSSIVSPVIGTLDGNGQASAAVTLAPGVAPFSAIFLFEMYHAYVVYDDLGSVVYASDAVRLQFNAL